MFGWAIRGGRWDDPGAGGNAPLRAPSPRERADRTRTQGPRRGRRGRRLGPGRSQARPGVGRERERRRGADATDRATRVAGRSPERPEEQGEHPTRHLRRLLQDGPKPLGHDEHLLPDGETGEHLVGQLSGHLCHASGITRGTDPPSHAGEGQDPAVPAVGAAQAREEVGPDSARQVPAEVALHPPQDASVHGVGLLQLGKERLQLMLGHRVQGCLGGAARAVDSTGWALRWRCRHFRRVRPSAGGLGRGRAMQDHVPTHREPLGSAMAGSAMDPNPHLLPQDGLHRTHRWARASVFAPGSRGTG